MPASAENRGKRVPQPLSSGAERKHPRNHCWTWTSGQKESTALSCLKIRVKPFSSVGQAVPDKVVAAMGYFRVRHSLTYKEYPNL